MAPTLHTLRVFTTADGRFGNPLGVFLDGDAVPVAERQAVAADVGYSETVFVEDRVSGALQIYTPAVELPLAGHPLVGTAWLLGYAGKPVAMLRPPAGEVATWSEGELTWIRGRPEWGTPYDKVQLAAPDEVLAHPTPGEDAMVAAWAWEDEAAGRLRARVFPRAIGIVEDEATGAAALQFGAELGREVVIVQGEGSELHVRPGEDGTVAVGGRVALDSAAVYSPA